MQADSTFRRLADPPDGDQLTHKLQWPELGPFTAEQAKVLDAGLTPEEVAELVEASPAVKRARRKAAKAVRHLVDTVEYERKRIELEKGVREVTP